MARAKKIMEETIDPLDAMLARLQLSGIRDQLDSLLDEAARVRDARAHASRRVAAADLRSARGLRRCVRENFGHGMC